MLIEEVNLQKPIIPPYRFIILQTQYQQLKMKAGVVKVTTVNEPKSPGPLKVFESGLISFPALTKPAWVFPEFIESVSILLFWTFWGAF